MRRREFISVLCGAVAACPLAAHAQRQAMVVVGFLTARSPGEADHLISAFRQGLEEAGYVEGGNIQVEYRWAEGRNSRLPALARDLVRRQVAVIAATGTPPTLAAKAATDTIPIVFSVAVDPVKVGLVASLSRPGSNATGVAQFSDVLATKHLELLTALVPTATAIGFLVDPNYPDTEARSRNVEQAGRLLGRRIVTLNASGEREIDKAFTALVQQQIGGLLVDNVALFNSHRDQIVTLAARGAIPAIYELREFVVKGGLISYGADLSGQYRQVGEYVAKILRGEKASDLPVQQPTKFEMVINLRTAKLLGLSVPPTLLARADEVIE